MNFLAHTYLARSERELVVGNFIADYLRGQAAVTALPPAVQRGVALHRFIDAFTDGHEAVRASYALIKPLQGRYASVLLDVFYDYLLVQHWDRYATEPLEGFAEWVYGVLLDHVALYPPFLQVRLPLMVADNWLVQYGKVEGLHFTFGKMAQRLRHAHRFEAATDDLLMHEAALSAHFQVFFPELVAAVEGWLRKESK